MKSPSYQKLALRLRRRDDLWWSWGWIPPEESEATFEGGQTGIQRPDGRAGDQNWPPLLKGEYDGNNAILAFHCRGRRLWRPRTGPRCSHRMYTRWAERHGYKCKVLDYLSGEEGGVKSASILIEGENAYGFLKSEAGVHRLVRISPLIPQ